MAQSEGAAWRKFLKPLVGAAVLFFSFVVEKLLDRIIAGRVDKEEKKQ